MAVNVVKYDRAPSAHRIQFSPSALEAFSAMGSNEIVAGGIVADWLIAAFYSSSRAMTSITAKYGSCFSDLDLAVLAVTNHTRRLLGECGIVVAGAARAGTEFSDLCPINILRIVNVDYAAAL